MLAIPVLRSRVAPVLNWCSRIQIFPKAPSPEGAAQELVLPHLEAFQRLQFLRDKGVSTLICGALSADLLRKAGEIGISVVSGVAGEVHDVVHSYWQNTLDHPRFWLPGCRGLRRYRGGLLKGQGLPCDAEAQRIGGSKRRGPGRTPPEQGLGPGGFCLCPACGAQVPHEQGIPCTQVSCPHCGQIMTRG